MDMSKYKSLFISDTAEHLDALERDLVQLDQAPGDAERINEVFRHMHSIKGMAASMGYDPMARLAHLLEDLMTSKREGGTPLSTGEIDFLLGGLDEFRKQLRAVQEDKSLEQVPEELAAGLERLLRSEKAARQAPPEPVAAPEVEQAPLSEDAREYLIEATIDARSETPSVRAFLVYKRLSELGRVTSVTPGLEDLRAGRFEGREISFRLVTDKASAEINRLAASLVDVDNFEVRVAKAKEPLAAQPAGSKGGKPQPPAGSATVRVQTELLDFFIDSVGELVTLRSFFEELAEKMDSAAIRAGVQRLGKVVRRLHDRVMEIRMVPVSLLTQRLPRVCRDVARNRNKQVQLVIEGEDVEIDRALVEELDTPLLHLLRNAIDHGIESPEERRRAGKPPTGKLVVQVQRGPDRFVLSVSDDGRGIDRKRVMERALKMQPPLVGAQAQADALSVIFRPGFSTRDSASEISGRGVGLDAVKAALDKLGGRIRVSSQPGQGTTFELDLPLTLAILQVLLVEAGEHRLAVPASRVMRVVALEEGKLLQKEKKTVLRLADEELPLVDLLAVLDGKQADLGETVIVGENGQASVALGVGQVSGHTEVVLKGIGPLLKALGPFGGTAVLGDGEPLLILDVDALMGMLDGDGEEQAHES